MPFICCVPQCKGNYPTGPKVQVFQFPKELQLKREWQAAINRPDFIPNESSKVCELHFKEEDISKTATYFNKESGRIITYNYKVPKLSPNAVPSIFPKHFVYLSGPKVVTRLKIRKKIPTRETKIDSQASVEISTEETISNLADIKNCLLPDNWYLHDCGDHLFIYRMREEKNGAAKMERVIRINIDLCANAFFNSLKLSHVGDFILPQRITSRDMFQKLISLFDKYEDERQTRDDPDFSVTDTMQLILSLLSGLKNDTNKFKNFIWFIAEQISLLIDDSQTYSSDLLVLSSLFYNISPHAYRFIKDSKTCLLPPVPLVQKIILSDEVNLAFEPNRNNFLFNIKQRFKSLRITDKKIVLLVDEINLKSFFDFKGGDVADAKINNVQAATIGFSFMVSSVFSDYKDIVHVLPSNKMTAEMLSCFIKKIIKGLENLGFIVIAVVSDNNTINRKAMTFFSSPPSMSFVYPHPSAETRPLFFLFDSFQILRCVRDNWLNANSPNKTISFPPFKFSNFLKRNTKFPLDASFDTLRKLFRAESDFTLESKYKLSLKALFPSHIEKQSFTYSIQVFNDCIVDALLKLGQERELVNHVDTSEFIRIFNIWWTIVNLKGPPERADKSNHFKQPLKSDVCTSKVFMEYFLEWLKSWELMNTDCDQLKQEMFFSIFHTTHGLLELSNYCLEELAAKQVLLGKFQTDYLAGKFGQNLLLSESVSSLKEIFETEKKFRTMSVLKIELNSQIVVLVDFSLDWLDFDVPFQDLIDLELLTKDDFKTTADYLPVITCIGSYCCLIVDQKLQCRFCRERLIDSRADITCFENLCLTGISKSLLLYPNNEVIRIVSIVYIILEKLFLNKEFHNAKRQHQLCASTCYNILLNEEIPLLSKEPCFQGHTSSQVVKIVIWVCSNVLLKNYCARMNYQIVEYGPFSKRR